MATSDGSPGVTRHSTESRDAPGRRRAEEAALEGDTILRALLKSASEAVVIVDGDGRIVLVSARAEEMFGYSRDELLAQPVEILMPARFRKAHDDHRADYYSDSHTTRVGVCNKRVARRKDGSKFPVDISLSPLETEEGLLVTAIIRDTSERKRAEEALRESEERFRVALMNSPVVVFSQDSELRYTWIHNPVPGFNVEDILGKTDEDLLPPEEASRLTAIKRRVLDSGASTREEIHATARGEVIFHDLTVEPLRDATGTIVGITGASFDITERKRAEEALRESEERYRDLFESASDLIQIVAPDGSLIYVNRAWREALGYSEEEIPGLSLFDIIHPDSKADCIEMFQRVIEGQDVGLVEAMFLTKDGRTIMVEGTCNCRFRDDEPNTIRGIFRDISVRRRAEEALGKARDELEMRVQERTAELTSANEQLQREISDRKRAKEALRRIEWQLTKSLTPKSAQQTRKEALEPPYGNLVELNTRRLLLDSVGEDILADIASEFLDVLDTSAAVYEKNGDYALGIFASRWCRFLDQASRKLCGTDDNREALASGKWHCHESCWSESAKVSIETGQPVDNECPGGIRLYAVPIRAGGEIVGSINCGYGDPPQDRRTLQEIAERYGVSVDKLLEKAKSYESRPPFMIDLAKNRLLASARLIGEVTERKRAEEALRQLNEKLEVRVQERTADLTRTNENLNEEISERKRAEEALREIEENLAKAQEIARIGSWTWDLATNTVKWSDQMYRLFDISPDEFDGKIVSVMDRIHPDDRDLLAQVTDQTLIDGKPRPLEYRVVRRDGTSIVVYAEGVTHLDESGKAVRMLGTVQDITERKRAEEALQQAREELEGRVERQLLRRNPYGLTFRELTVLHLVAAGKSGKEIATELGISPLTVQKHLSNILTKMDAASRTEAVARGLREGLLD